MFCIITCITEPVSYTHLTDRLKAALRKGTCECTAVPVCCGSAYRNKGVQKLLDAILEYMPAPTDIPPVSYTHLMLQE